jgi:hypothetical protein
MVDILNLRVLNNRYFKYTLHSRFLSYSMAGPDSTIYVSECGLHAGIDEQVHFELKYMYRISC